MNVSSLENKQPALRPLKVTAFFCSVIVCLLAAYWLGVRVNMTRSVPQGFYLESGKSPTKGDYVMFCPPVKEVFTEALKRGYIPPGLCPGNYGRMMKVVAAAAGDVVDIGHEGVAVNKVLLPHSRPIDKDNLGRRLPSYRLLNFSLSHNDLLLMTNMLDNSFDARYFGVLSREHIDSVVTPILIW